jgi:formylglycine-generating enzyme required for sulfatase activity
LFVGIGAFDPGSNLGSLKYAPDDAIALAHLFALELQLIPAARTRVALGGLPRSKKGETQLAELKAAGAQLVGADKNALLTALRQIKADASQPDGLIVVSVATHGFEDGGGQYLMPSNGLREEPATTGIPLNLVKQRLQEAATRKRILLLDACREAVEGGTRGSETATAGLRESFAKAEGFAVLGSCSAKQLSWESDDLQQGVFTHHFLQALKGGVGGSPSDGLIRLGDVAQWVAVETAKWAKANRNVAQEPWTEGEIARQIPLAVDPGTARQLAEARATAEAEARKAREQAAAFDKRRKDALKLARNAQADHDAEFAKETLDAVEKALARSTGNSVEELVRRLERHFRKPTVEGDDVVDFLNWWRDHEQSERTSTFIDSLLIPTNRVVRPLRVSELGIRTNAARTDAAESQPGSIFQSLLLAPTPEQTVVNSIDTTLLPVPAGSFVMGSEDGDGDEKPVTTVTISRKFWLGKYEVTQGEWKAVMEINPSSSKGDLLPVERVTWEDCQEFLRKLNARERAAGNLPAGYEYGLPTEAEWEYACRAGTTGKWVSGDSEEGLAEYAWYDANSGKKTHDVGTKKANGWGFHDMHGNVWEWCSDWKGDYLGGSVTDPTGPKTGSHRVNRGGGWSNTSGYCRSAYRTWNPVADRGSDLGFRLALRGVYRE